MRDDSGKGLDVVGIGNALVDVLAHVDDRFLTEHGVTKGVMRLIGADLAVDLYRRMRRPSHVSGGSTANTAAGIALLGGSAGFIGKVKDDALGRVFAEDLAGLGVAYTTPAAPASAACETGRSLILVTPDGERSMNTYLGAAEFLTWPDFDLHMIESARWIYFEGYRFDGPDSQEAFRLAVRRSHRAGGKAAVTLADPFCVERNRTAFRALIDDGIELLFCNRTELLSLYRTDDLDRALAEAASQVETVACTLAAEGAVVASGARRIKVAAMRTEVVDATGAGDQFAAGFFYGLTGGAGLEAAARMGCAVASEAIGHIGARPVADLGALLRNYGLPHPL